MKDMRDSVMQIRADGLNQNLPTIATIQDKLHPLEARLPLDLKVRGAVLE
jgi:hypothetical protein